MYARYIPPANGPGDQKTSSPPPAPEPASAPQPALATIPAPQAVGGAGFSYSRYVPGTKPSADTAELSRVQYFDDEPGPPSSKRKRDADDEPRPSPEVKSNKSKKSKVPMNRDVPAKVEESKTEPPPDAQSRRHQKGNKAIDHPRTDTSVGASQSSSPSDQSPAGTGNGDKKPSKKERKSKKSKRDQAEELIHTNSEDPREDPDTSMVDIGDSGIAQSGISPDSDTKKLSKKKEKKKSKEKDVVTSEPDGKTAAGDDDTDKRHRTVLERKAKSLKLASKSAPEAGEGTSEQEQELEPLEVHDLEPLPQPNLVSEETPNPTYETLPSWLAAPIRVSQETRTPFSKLGLLPKAARILEEKGFPEAFAVQTAAVPLLLPSSKRRPGDLLISAATGSGKTLAYALPIVRDISQGLVTRLRALVVLPTRELVRQAQDVFELCAKAYEGGDRKRVRIGVAIGSQTLRSEQEHLVKRETRYDPGKYERILEQRRVQKANASSSTDIDRLLGATLEETYDARLGEWDGQVNDFSSKVDVLICTPGRLVEHLEQTPGFDLDYVRWLVVDEADKLLAQSFQGWLDAVMEKFRTRKFTAREFPDMDYEGVRKVVLSATLTRDLSLLHQLTLRRPQLIVLESDSDVQGAEHSLPALLEEFAVRVHDINLKPLYLLDLLRSNDMTVSSHVSQPRVSIKDTGTSSEATSASSSAASSDSDDTSSDSESDSDAESAGVNSKTELQNSTLPTCLIFTKSNESALRLSRLLTLLDKSLSPHITTLTSTTPTHIRRKTLRAFSTPSSPVRLIIASDLVARGIDIPNLANVANYDLPPSVAGYVHRVGRTARAGRSGRAWTLVEDGESGWFWGKIAKGAGVRRSRKVERIRIDEMSEERVESYEAALARLGQEATETRKK